MKDQKIIFPSGAEVSFSHYENDTAAKKYQGKVFSGLVNLELNLGNNCNIKCRTCHPSISSQWMKEERKFLEKEEEKCAVNPAETS